MDLSLDRAFVIRDGRGSRAQGLAKLSPSTGELFKRLPLV
jgi:hypothetical protein